MTGRPLPGNYNPPAGTVVDRGITMERGHDFYLQAHHSLKGTARPTHYVVILDQIGHSADDIQKATHALSYANGRATKAVSLCPPAFYADMVCERGRKYLAQHLSSLRQTGGQGATFNVTDAPWTGGVHEDLQDSMVSGHQGERW